VKWAMHGMVDIRLTLIILAGSLLGVQLGAIGTTYVKENMIKIVMGIIMLIVAASRALAVPQYLNQLQIISVNSFTLSILEMVSFATMCLALAIGAVIIIGSMIKGKKAEYAAQATESYEHV
ncbi:MAG: sulfite exporter TauE/SafE family protein, partial [Desulfomonilaceae bacterium]